MDNEDIMMEDQMSEGYEPDDFEVMNQNEADDYRNEMEANLPEMDTPLGEEYGGE